MMTTKVMVLWWLTILLMARRQGYLSKKQVNSQVGLISAIGSVTQLRLMRAQKPSSLQDTKMTRKAISVFTLNTCCTGRKTHHMAILTILVRAAATRQMVTTTLCGSPLFSIIRCVSDTRFKVAISAVNRLMETCKDKVYSPVWKSHFTVHNITNRHIYISMQQLT